ncbi:MAG TPA: multiheme c-type cytochrome, partial [Isosphaeraceae bacterium]
MRVLGWRGGWGYALPVALAAACLPLGRSAAPADAPGPKPPAVAAEAVAASAPGWVGSGRCSGRGCHGAVAPEGTKGSEFNTWATHDRHARAFDVLLEERSRQLERNLRGEAAGRAEADALCLACHDQPGPRPVPALAATGVGCESCHGAAGGWLAEHSTVQWRTMTFEEKSGRGLVPMSTAAERTRVCVRCHVGTAGQEVNHDLIAAGHPRLDFEAKAFLDDMPPHWDVADVAGKRGAFQAAGEHWAVTTVQTWAVGQIVTAQASL